MSWTPETPDNRTYIQPSHILWFLFWTWSSGNQEVGNKIRKLSCFLACSQFPHYPFQETTRHLQVSAEPASSETSWLALADRKLGPCPQYKSSTLPKDTAQNSAQSRLPHAGVSQPGMGGGACQPQDSPLQGLSHWLTPLSVFNNSKSYKVCVSVWLSARPPLKLLKNVE